MASYNRVVLVGNLTRDVELRYTPNNTAVTDISIAVNERIKRNDQWTDEVHYFDITLWSRLAEIAAEYLSKGSSVLIEGRLRLDRWEQEGKNRSKIKIVGEKMQMLSSRGGGGNGASADASNHDDAEVDSSPVPQTAPADEDLPF